MGTAIAFPNTTSLGGVDLLSVAAVRTPKMISKTSTLNLSSLDSDVITSIRDIRLARLTIARRQLEHLEKTASEIRSLPTIKFAADEFSLPDLKKVLVDKINILEKRANSPLDVYPDEMDLALEVMEKRNVN